MELTPREAQQWREATERNVRDARRRMRQAPRVTDEMRETLQAHIKLRRKARRTADRAQQQEAT